METLPVNEQNSINNPDAAPVVSGDQSAVALNESTYFNVLQTDGLEDLSPVIIDPRAAPVLDPETQQIVDTLKQQIEQVQMRVEGALDNYERSGFIGRAIMGRDRPLYSSERLESIGSGRLKPGERGRTGRRFLQIGQKRATSRADRRYSRKLSKIQRKANNAMLTSIAIKDGTAPAREGLPNKNTIKSLKKQGVISKDQAKEMKRKTKSYNKIKSAEQRIRTGKFSILGKAVRPTSGIAGKTEKRETKNLKKIDKYVSERNDLILQLGRTLRDADDKNPGIILEALSRRSSDIDTKKQNREHMMTEIKKKAEQMQATTDERQRLDNVRRLTEEENEEEEN